MRINTFSFLIIFCLIGGVAGYIISLRENRYCHVTITLESSEPVEAQLFYDIGKGFNENDSIRKIIYQKNAPVTLYFDISGPSIDGLRFDPSQFTANLKIYEIIVKYDGEKPFSVPLDSLKPVNDIKLLNYEGKALSVETTESAHDPILKLTRISSKPHFFKFRALMFILAGAVISLAITFLVAWVYRNCMNGKERVNFL